MTDQQFAEEILTRLETVNGAQKATASTVRSLVQALRTTEEHRQGEDGRLLQVEKALLQLISHVRPVDLSNITADELAAQVPNATICAARAIQFQAKTGEPLPLPPAPTELVPPAHHHRRKDDGPNESYEHRRRKDDSIAFKKDKRGDTKLQANVKVKTLFGWILAGALALFEAYEQIKKAMGK